MREKSGISLFSGDSNVELPKAEQERARDASADMHDPKVPPKPFLKRKTKPVVVPKEQQKKPAGKSRIDCWHRDKDTNTIIYGNKMPPAPVKNLLIPNASKSSKQIKAPVPNQVGAAALTKNRPDSEFINQLYIDLQQVKY